MEQKLYLLTTLVEYADCVSDKHYLFRSWRTAEIAFSNEIRDCAENFTGQRGNFIINLPTCQEWRTDEGNGYTVTLEEVKAL